MSRWIYHQATGDLFLDGAHKGRGYAGAGKTAAGGRNNPAMEGVVAKGPIPRGRWKMTGLRLKHPALGPYVILLEPVGHSALGRSAFRIHGDNAAGDASHGCIILSRDLREQIWTSGIHDLVVVA
jgi:hypothetical protein